MATCRKCIHWDKCSKADGTTRFYGKEVACNDAEKLCEWFISTTEVAPIADTVRKMQERLREAPIKVGLPLFGLQTKDEIEDYANGLILQMRDAIDQIAKEMIEDAE